MDSSCRELMGGGWTFSVQGVKSISAQTPRKEGGFAQKITEETKVGDLRSKEFFIVDLKTYGLDAKKGIERSWELILENRLPVWTTSCMCGAIARFG